MRPCVARAALLSLLAARASCFLLVSHARSVVRVPRARCSLSDGVDVDARQELEAENTRLRARVDELEEQLGRTEGLCEVLDSGADFVDSFRSRASWLLGLLICQSGSSFILEGNEALIQSHPVIVYFMTMLVGAGGNAGNQASVRIIRGLATGEVNPASERSFIASEVRMAAALSVIVVGAGFVRVIAFDATPTDAFAISLALFLIVGSSIVLGTLLPLLLNRLRLDAAHASTTIQVVMDVLGVTIACTVRARRAAAGTMCSRSAGTICSRSASAGR